jgi:hypothetical protein
MKIDFSKFDIFVTIGASPRQGHWGSVIVVNGSRSFRACGRLPQSTAHSLLSIALVSSLKSATRSQVENLLRNKSQRKLRLQIASEDADYVEALRSLVKVQRPDKPLRASKNLFKDLARQLNRFDCDFALVDSDVDHSVSVLRNWAGQKLPDPRTLNVPAVFLPSVVGTIN